LLLEAIINIYWYIYRHKTCVVVGFVDDVLLDVWTIFCWSCLCCCGWKKSKWFGVCFKLNIIFVVGDVDINGTVVVFVEFWLGKKTWWDKRELKSSNDDDIGEKTIDWENCEANDDDGERQLVIGQVVSLNFDEYVISIGADWSGWLFGSSKWFLSSVF
jgi:hypothetical protein